jgi:putative ABC transport system permease protein
MKINFKRVLRELNVYKGRTSMALIGILIGVTSIGFVLSAYAILEREMNSNYMSTNPSSISLKVRNLDSNGIELVKGMEKNIDIEARKTLVARVDRGNGTKGTIYLFAVEEFNNLKVDICSLEKGEFPKNSSEMVLERDSLKNLSNIKNGYDENILINLPGGNETMMNLSGKVHAPNLAPASMEKYSYAFLTLEGLQKLGYQGWYDEIHLVSYDNRFDRVKLQKSAEEMKERLVQAGYIVDKVDVPVPGKHPHGDQLNSLLFLLQAFAVICLFVACIIIVNLLNFIMSKQTKQIAIMKAMGANTFDIAIPYFLYVLIISIVAIIISIPISIALGCGYSNFAASILNFNITSYRIPFLVFLVQAITGIIIPILASFYSVYRSSKITVKEGLSEQIISKRTPKDKNFSIRKLFYNTNSKIKIPINNVFRKKGRTALSILALATGGVLFITSQNIVASINNMVNKSTKVFYFDYDIRLFGQYTEDKLMQTLSTIDNVDKVEVYKSDTASFKNLDGIDSTSYLIKVLPQNSKLIDFKFLEGSRTTDCNKSIIINKALLDEENWIKVGMKINMEVGGKSELVTVAGIVTELPPIPTIYLNTDSYEKYFNGVGMQNILISAKPRDQEDQIKISKAIEEEFKASGINIAQNWNINLLRLAFVEHLNVIVTFLSIISLMAVLVGGLSIASSISISISERRRELGILRAVGVNSIQMIKMISFEVILMGLAGWLIGLIIAYPISIYAGNYFGQIFLHSNLNNTLSIPGAIMWLVISIVVSFISGNIPARMAANTTLSEMLTYE